MMTLRLKKLGKNLIVRGIVRDIIPEDCSEKSFILDFSGVESATPSFIHELITTITKMDASFHVQNAHPFVETQIKRVIQAIKRSDIQSAYA
jgi:hypothetical protein